ncbi:MAG TPA: hypothetical protein VFX30_15050 [bacterium]|nr:hypothetical protein [bacterium]
MSLNQTLIRSVMAVFTTVLLLSANACVFSRSPIKDFVLTPEETSTETTPQGGDIVASNDSPTNGDTVVPQNPGPQAPQDEAPSPPETPSETPAPAPTPSPAPLPKTCRRIAYVEKADGPSTSVVVTSDCAGAAKIPVPETPQIIIDLVIQNARPTFSLDGTQLTTYRTSWTDGDAASLQNVQSLWNVEGDEAILKDEISGDRTGDGLLDVARFLNLQDPANALGVLTVTSGAPVCGNGVVEGFEACDDGNQNNFDLCTDDCRLHNFGQTPVGPAFAKTLTYTKKGSAAGGLAIQRQILQNDATLGDAAFTGEGSVIFSARLAGDADVNIYAVDLNDAASAPARVSGLSEDGVKELQPSVSPDGSKIVYARGTEIWTCELTVFRTPPLDRKNYGCIHNTKLSNGRFDPAVNFSPCFDADASHVFFVSNALHGENGFDHDQEVWRVDADGANETNVTDDGFDQKALACSPR